MGNCWQPPGGHCLVMIDSDEGHSCTVGLGLDPPKCEGTLLLSPYGRRGNGDPGRSGMPKIPQLNN